MTVITLTTGLPGSGKSTWALEQVANSNGSTVRVNLDDLRVMLGIDPTANDPATKELIKVMYSIQDKAILAAVAAGKDVIVDNTHLTKTIPTRIKKLFDGEIEFRVADFTDVPIEWCILRDDNRERIVGEKIIRDMARHLRKPWRLTAEFMNDYEYPLIPFDTREPSSHGYDREPIVVFDIDGTLARHHRSPYDYSQLHTDSAFEHVSKLARLYSSKGYMIAIVSGRPDTYREETVHWLMENHIPFNFLRMRRASDTRNDADVKHEIFDTFIRPSFEVEFWFDDRDRVVRRLRKLGINVAQVAPGDF